MYFNQFHSSSNVALHLSALTDKVDEVATRAGVSAFDRLDLEGALAGLPWPERRRLSLILEATKAGANSDALCTAVDMINQLASDTWARTPPPDHSTGKK